MNRQQMMRTVLGVVAAVAVGAAIFDQLRLPAKRRSWQGHLWVVPYDLRFPTPERLREKVWNKDTSRIVMPHFFGVGWSLNLYPLFHPAMLGKKK